MNFRSKLVVQGRGAADEILPNFGRACVTCNNAIMPQNFVRHHLWNPREYVSFVVTGNQVSVHVVQAAPPIGSPRAWNAETRLDSNLFDSFNRENQSYALEGGKFPLKPEDQGEFPQRQPSARELRDSFRGE